MLAERTVKRASRRYDRLLTSIQSQRNVRPFVGGRGVGREACMRVSARSHCLLVTILPYLSTSRPAALTHLPTRYRFATSEYPPQRPRTTTRRYPTTSRVDVRYYFRSFPVFRYRLLLSSFPPLYSSHRSVAPGPVDRFYAGVTKLKKLKNGKKPFPPERQNKLL